ncbi:hypothetical protein H4K38_04310 [Streptomyces sp. I3(2020)]|nr:hypothetical protein [Streptomyces sp. I3(2020)]
MVLAGAARGRVQFGTPRPLDAVEFGLPGDTLPTAASVRRALEQEFPGARVRPSAVTDDGRTLALSVDGVTIRITATGRPYSGTVRTDGFTLPAPADSVADAALTLATATGQDSRGRDLLDLLWALRATSADGTPSLTPATLPEDAYRAARPAGAPASLAVRLSEVLDTAALDADTLARHERTWRDLGVADADLPGLRAELSGLAHALRTAPEVSADPVRTLAARLPGMSATDRNAALALLTPADRERLAADPALVDALRAATDPEEFASVAADLMTQVPPGVGQPVSARVAARTRIARMLRDPEVTARLLKGGSRVVVVPRTEALTSLDAFRLLSGAVTGDGRPWDGVRGVGTRTAAVTEENLLGERTTVGSGMSAYPDGYSTTVHEFAHTVHLHGLDATDRQRVTNAFRTTTRHGEAGAWPDGPLHSRDADGRRSAPNYSSRDEREFFAQLTNVYLRANGATTPTPACPASTRAPSGSAPASPPSTRCCAGSTATRPTRAPRTSTPSRPPTPRTRRWPAPAPCSPWPRAHRPRTDPPTKPSAPCGTAPPEPTCRSPTHPLPRPPRCRRTPAGTPPRRRPPTTPYSAACGSCGPSSTPPSAPSPCRRTSATGSSPPCVSSRRRAPHTRTSAGGPWTWTASPARCCTCRPTRRWTRPVTSTPSPSSAAPTGGAAPPPWTPSPPTASPGRATRRVPRSPAPTARRTAGTSPDAPVSAWTWV